MKCDRCRVPMSQSDWDYLIIVSDYIMILMEEWIWCQECCHQVEDWIRGSMSCSTCDNYRNAEIGHE